MFQLGELAGGQKGKPGGQCKINHIMSLLSFDESKPVPGEVEGGEGGEVVKAGGGQAEGDQGDHQDEEDMMLVTFINMALILRRYCIVMTSIWYRYDINIALIWHQYGIDISSILHRYCINMASILHQHCIDIASISHRYCMDMASILPRYCIKSLRARCVP